MKFSPEQRKRLIDKIKMNLNEEDILSILDLSIQEILENELNKKSDEDLMNILLDELLN